ncbi:MAG: CDGSH iron-sulfur domain-containing protein [Hyphomonadaceae bacterium]|nr:CDGSH iron-sulfur domain-containing protein [Hyphomonadaceae bacterium]
MSIERAPGEKITLIFDGKKCIHARECVTGAPKTFLANVEGPWLHPDETPVERLVEIAHRCPSGAVAYERHDGGPPEAPPPVNIGHVRENGPIALHGDLVLNGAAIGCRATLCRCGASKNKPYCDGSHVAAGFTASGEPVSRRIDALASRDGPLAIAPQKDGPLKVEGNLELCAGTGRVVERATQMFLCRCGASKNKPFCDGAHKAIGFVAD